MADEPGDEPLTKEPKYDQEFFLKLAREGKRDAWNTWRRDQANKDVRVTFAGIDFSVTPRDQINFAGFEFGDYADFSRCKWVGHDLGLDRNAFVPGRAYFSKAKFGARANFGGAKLGYSATFTGAVFGDGADFSGVAFGFWTKFTGATFGDLTLFAFAVFASGAYFDCAAFGDNTNFIGVDFDQNTTFNNAIFNGVVGFNGQSKKEYASFVSLLYGGDARIEYENLLEKLEKTEFKRDRFLGISFAGAQFDGVADFSGRTFEETANFTEARFYSPPVFDAAAKDARIDFTGAHIGFVPPGKLAWTKGSQIPVRLRALRKLAEETKNHDLERDLYIEERKAERGVYWRQLSDELKRAPEELRKKLEDINKQKKHVWLEWRLQRRARHAHRLGIAVKAARLAAHGFWIAVMGVYWSLSDYGRSFVRPAAWLVSSVFFFDWRYTDVLSQLMAKAPDLNKYKQALGMLALGNAVPFVGPLTIDSEIKNFLFCPGCDPHTPAIPPEGFQFLVITQNLFSITCVFFIVLALRNYFRIK